MELSVWATAPPDSRIVYNRTVETSTEAVLMGECHELCSSDWSTLKQHGGHRGLLNCGLFKHREQFPQLNPSLRL